MIDTLMGIAGLLIFWPFFLLFILGMILSREREDKYNFYNRERGKYTIKTGEIFNLTVEIWKKYYGIYTLILGIILLCFTGILSWMFK